MSSTAGAWWGLSGAVFRACLVGQQPRSWVLGPARGGEARGEASGAGGWQRGCPAALPAPPALPAADDGAVQEVLAHGGPQHPEQQAHQQQAGALPEGELGRPAWSGLACRLPPARPEPRLPPLPSPQGENPFTDSPEEEKEQEEAEGGALDEAAEGSSTQPPVPREPAPGAAPPPPPPPEEEEEEAVPLLGGALQRQIRGIPGLDVEDEEEGGGGVP